MSTTRRKSTEDPEEDQQARLVEARAETEKRLAANDKLHEDAQRKGARMRPHRQDPSLEVMPTDRVADAGATTVVEIGGDLQHVGQEELGMKPLQAHTPKGAALQPPAPTHTTWTVSNAALSEDGRPLTFTNPATGSAMGSQGRKTSGAQHILSGGAGVGGVIMADLPTVDRILPTFSDRVITDPDMPPTGSAGVVSSGAVNPKRATAPEALHMSDKPQSKTTVAADNPALDRVVHSDRLAQSEDEMTQVVTPAAAAERPHAHDAGQALGMGETVFHRGNAALVGETVVADRHVDATTEVSAKPEVPEPTAAERKAARKATGKQDVAHTKVEQKDADKAVQKAEVTDIPAAKPDSRPADQANADDRPADQANAEATH